MESNNNLLPKTTNSNPYELALETDVVIKMNKAAAIRAITDMLSKLYYDTGQTIPGYGVDGQADNLRLLAGEVYNEVEKAFRALRIGELKMLIDRGARLVYGEYYGINVITIYKWLRGYQADANRIAAARKAAQDLDAAKSKIMSKDEAELAFAKAIESAFNFYREAKILSITFPLVTLTWLNDREKLFFTDELWEGALKFGTQEVLKQKRAQRLNPKNKQHLTDLSRVIERIVTGAITKDENAMIEQEAANVIIRHYFDELITDNQPFLTPKQLT